MGDPGLGLVKDAVAVVDGAQPLVRIAEECGFSSQSALTTAMRRYLGLTPKRLRGLQ